MQLLKIVNQPIEYKLNVEPARLEMKQAQNPRGDFHVQPGQWDIQSKNTQVRIDTTQMRASLNLRNSSDFASHFASKGLQTAKQATGEAVQMGNQMQQIQDGVTISQIVQQKVLEQPTTYTTFLPSVGADISWEPQQLKVDYQPSEVSFDWQIMQNQMNYVPGKFSMDILQYPNVDIEYLGGPNYVPPSSDPNYEEESA